MRLVAVFAWAVAVTLTGLLPSHAEQRVALVVGNSDYRYVGHLTNAVNDARLIASTLRDLGFTLIGGGALVDLDKAGIDRAVLAFGAGLHGADVALFYYSGHGVQVRGSNYIVPIDANATREADVDFQMLDVSLVLRQMEAAGTRLNVVLLDACRNNPFAGRGLRATGGGLAQMQAPEGTLISYATQPGAVAWDGTDGNGPYAKALATMMREPNLDLFNTFNEVGLAVRRATGGEQQPWVSSSPISGSFYFAAATPGTSAPPKLDIVPPRTMDNRRLTVTEPHDPLRTVTAFYDALAKADGTAAARLVIPEKRGAGAFNEKNITTFYGSLREPLAVLNIARAGDDTVSVQYRFTRANGTACAGSSTVSTVFIGGETLIKGISANC